MPSHSFFSSDPSVKIRNCLGAFERSLFSRLPAPKQADWLAGRFVAKRLLQQKMRQVEGATLELSDIEIRSAGQRPTFALLVPARFPINAYSLAISHTQGSALAALSHTATEGLVGVDIETERTFRAAFLASFLTEQELIFLRALPVASRNKYATLFWCYKEAYLKARGIGLSCHPKRLTLRLKANGALHELTCDGKKVALRAELLALPEKKIGVIVYTSLL